MHQKELHTLEQTDIAGRTADRPVQTFGTLNEGWEGYEHSQDGSHSLCWNLIIQVEAGFRYCAALGYGQ